MCCSNAIKKVYNWSKEVKYFPYLLISVSNTILHGVGGDDNRDKLQGRSQTFQNGGAARGAHGADWDSKWQHSIDPCTKCHFIWGGLRGEGLGFWQRGLKPSCLHPWQAECTIRVQHTSQQYKFLHLSVVNISDLNYKWS